MTPKYWKLTTCARFGMTYHYYHCPQKALDEIAERFGVEWKETRYKDGRLASAVTMPTEEGRMFSLSPLIFEDEEEQVAGGELEMLNLKKTALKFESSEEHMSATIKHVDPLHPTIEDQIYIVETSEGYSDEGLVVYLSLQESLVNLEDAIDIFESFLLKMKEWKEG